MYNSIYPVNINYRKHNQYRQSNDDAKSSSNAQISNENNQQSNTFPNGTKVAVDYTKGQINISQVLADFRSTILAINAPDDVREEVSLYLSLVEKESLKETPSKEIILANLKNASKISDAYIAKSLNKQSNVVEGWIDALFLQKINLKADPNEINPDFLLEFPKNAQDRIEQAKIEQSQENKSEVTDETEEIANEQDAVILEDEENIISQSNLELSGDEISSEVSFHDIKPKTDNPYFSPLCEQDVVARDLFVRAKNMPQTNLGDTDALNLLNEAKEQERSLKEAHKRLYGKSSWFNHTICFENKVMPTIVAGHSCMWRFKEKTQCSNQDFINGSTFPQDYNFGKENISYICGMSVPPLMIKRLVTRLIESGLFDYKLKIKEEVEVKNDK